MCQPVLLPLPGWEKNKWNGAEKTRSRGGEWWAGASQSSSPLLSIPARFSDPLYPHLPIEGMLQGGDKQWRHKGGCPLSICHQRQPPPLTSWMLPTHTHIHTHIIVMHVWEAGFALAHADWKQNPACAKSHHDCLRPPLAFQMTSTQPHNFKNRP